MDIIGNSDMNPYPLAFAICLVLSIPLTYLASIVGRKYHIYDEPNGRRANNGKIPRLGGIAIVLSFTVGLTSVLLYHDNALREDSILALLVGILGVFLLGLWDDIKYLRTRNKLAIQLAIACIVYYMGIRMQAIDIPFYGSLDLGDYAFPATVLWIVGAMNAINFIDGVDGLCASLTIIASIAIFILSLLLNNYLTGLFSIALVASILGFLPFNISPARIFLGDCGSYFLGFVISSLSICIQPNTKVNSLLFAPICFLAIPLLDALLSIVRRINHGHPISAPDKGHLHHILLDKGWSHRKISLILALLSALIAIAGIIVTVGTTTITIIFGLSAIVSVLYMLMLITGKSPIRMLKTPSESIYSDIVKSQTLSRFLPSFYLDLASASNWDEATAKLNEFSKTIDLQSAKICIGENGDSVIVWNWGNKGNSGFTPRRTAQLSKCYDIYDGTDKIGELYLSWTSELATVHKDTDALLKMTAEVIGRVWKDKAHESSVSVSVLKQKIG
jgi:UDP-GlcNAc:undecaprenyl-phosphate/decaprenyl-phosphate GlcNAc-1-phosphate transferase